MASDPANPGPILGVIADDLTGATDVGSALVKGGMRVAQFTGVPGESHECEALDAIVVALKSRSIPVADAVSQSLEALGWLCARGVRQLLFKYCSTFDSTDEGNIGPVAEALLDALGENQTIFCPAFPANGRTLYNGHLFVGDRLLSESGMRNHPITPMRDSDLRRVLARQSKREVGLIPWQTVQKGPAAIRALLATKNERFFIADGITDADLEALVEACLDMRLLTGGAGIALPLPLVYRRAGILSGGGQPLPIGSSHGSSAIVSGSCSEATLEQIAQFRAQGGQILQIDPLSATNKEWRNRARSWATHRLGDTPIMIASSADPTAVSAVQQLEGREGAGHRLEELLAAIAVDLVDAGVRRLVVAGGETSGAVVKALGVSGLYIGKEIAPGVPWTTTIEEPRISLALKSGNFGGKDFFSQAFEVQP